MAESPEYCTGQTPWTQVAQDDTPNVCGSSKTSDEITPPNVKQDHNAKHRSQNLENANPVIIKDMTSSEENTQRHNAEKDLYGNSDFSTNQVWLSLTAIVVFVVVSFISLVPIGTQYFSYRIARDAYNYSYNISSTNNKCSNSSDEQDGLVNSIQKDVSNFILYSTLIGSIPALFTCLVVGSYSDYLGRRPILFLACTGVFIRYLILCLIIEFELNIKLYYLGSLVDGLLGSYFTLTLSAVAVIADITPPKERAVRFAVIEGVLIVSSALSSLAVGYMIEGLGYFPPAAACGILNFLGMLVVALALPETMHSGRPFVINPLEHLKKVFGFYVTGAPKLRLQYGIGLAAFFTLMLNSLGRLTVETLFVMNSPICWGAIEIGIFNCIRMTVWSVAAVVVLKNVKGRVSLEVTGMVCCISAASGFVLESLAKNTTAMYFSALIGLLFATLNPLPRALLSEITSPLEQGALFSSLAVVETLSSMVSVTANTFIYNATIDFFKGTVFLVMAALCFIFAILLGAFRLVRRSHIVTHKEYTVQPEEQKEVSEDITPNDRTRLIHT